MLRLLFKKSETTELKNVYFFFCFLVQPLKKLPHQQDSSHPHLLSFLFYINIFLHASATVTITLLRSGESFEFVKDKGMLFAYQTLFFRPQGSWVLFFNCLRLTPCKWSRCQNPINQHFYTTSVKDIVMNANPNLPHPVVSNCETVAYPSVECVVKEREESAIVLEEGWSAILLLWRILSPR